MRTLINTPFCLRGDRDARPSDAGDLPAEHASLLWQNRHAHHYAEKCQPCLRTCVNHLSGQYAECGASAGPHGAPSHRNVHYRVHIRFLDDITARRCGRSAECSESRLKLLEPGVSGSFHLSPTGSRPCLEIKLPRKLGRTRTLSSDSAPSKSSGTRRL